MKINDDDDDDDDDGCHAINFSVVELYNFHFIEAWRSAKAVDLQFQ